MRTIRTMGRRGCALVALLALTLVLLPVVTTPASGAAAASTPAAAATATVNGDVFVADSGNDRVVKLPADGGPQITVGTGFSNPRGIAVDVLGNVFVADTGNDRVVKLPADGGAQIEVGSGFSAPRAVTVTSTGDVFVADTGNDRVVRIDGQTGVQKTLDVHFVIHTPIALGLQVGDLVAVVYDGRPSYLVLTSTGTVIGTDRGAGGIPAGSSSPPTAAST